MAHPIFRITGGGSVGPWYAKHNVAANGGKNSLHGHAMRKMIEGWADYAIAYRKQFESRIGDDGVLGSEWIEIGKALLALLNGDLGNFDAGTLDSNIRNLAMSEADVDDELNEK